MISVPPILTSAGKDLLVRSISGEQIVFTRFKIGNGELNGSEEALTDLVNAIHEFPISSADTSKDGFISLSGSFFSTDLSGDAHWRELGVFAKGADDVEQLYAYAYDAENASLLKATVTDVVIEMNVNVIVAIGDSQHVTAIISQSAMYASKADLENHLNDTNNPHKVTAALVGLGNVPNVSTNNQTPTYSVPSSMNALSSGEKLHVAFGKIARAVQNLIAHIGNKKNPHGVTAALAGAAEKTHYHAASDINSGILSIQRGGTGGGTAAAARTALNAAAKSRSAALTVPASAWTGDGPYTAAVACSIAAVSNHLVVGAGGALTEEQQESMAAAMIICTAQSAGMITLTAYGEMPEIDLPVHVLEVG